MERTELNGILTGGSIEQYDLDVRRNRLTMVIHVLENGKLSQHDVLFEKVSRFTYETESKSDAGERLEVTELWVDAGPESSATEEWDILISIFDLSHIPDSMLLCLARRGADAVTPSGLSFASRCRAPLLLGAPFAFLDDLVAMSASCFGTASSR